MTKEEKLERIKELESRSILCKRESDYHNAMQSALKLCINGSYGAFAAPYFCLFHNNVASSITSVGRELTSTMSRLNQDYWNNKWHLDTETHKKMYIRDVKRIDPNTDCSIYADTDSCDGSSIITTNKGKVYIEDWYNKSISNGSNGTTLNGHESVKTNDLILNYNNDGEIYYANVKRIIRHKVTKPKWKLITKSGKEVIVTNDHSMIVFRDGIKLEVKPSDILKTDKILII